MPPVGFEPKISAGERQGLSRLRVNVIHVRALINNSYNKSNRCTYVKIMLLHTVCLNSEMLRTIVITFREILNISAAYSLYALLVLSSAIVQTTYEYVTYKELQVNLLAYVY